MSLTQPEANRMWDDLRKGLLATQDAIKKIVENRAWEPLGYSSFIEAWEDRVKGIPLADAVQVEVVYLMFDQGATATEVSEATGTKKKLTEGLQNAKELGLPASVATFHAERVTREPRISDDNETIVRQHTRKRRSREANVHLHIGNEKLKEWRKYADEAQLDFKTWLEDSLIASVEVEIDGSRRAS